MKRATSKTVDLHKEIKPYRYRLERLTKRFLTPRFNGQAGLWKFESDLLQLQRDIQEAITKSKTGSRSNPESFAVLEELKTIRWYARQLGDAFAWITLGLDRKVIYSLGDNDRVPIANESHGTRGLIAIATHLASEEWGFPLIHDVTDCLRIGDVSFIKPNGDTRDIRTVEVKTRLTGQSDKDNGSETYSYQVTVLWPQAAHPAPNDSNPEDSDELGPAEIAQNDLGGGSIRKPHPRHDRQLRRMRIAMAQQEADDGTVVETENSNLYLSIGLDSSHPSHWETLRKVVRKARRSGFGSAEVDNTFMYIAIYREDGITKENIQDLQGAEQIRQSSILRFDGDRARELVVNPIPIPQGKAANRHLPFYLYSIPKTAIIDLLNGRLVIVVLANTERLLTAIEDAGFEVEVPTGSPRSSYGSWKIHSTVTIKSGETYRTELHGVAHRISETIYDFKRIDYLIEALKSMRDTSVNAFIERQRSSGNALPF